jgi:predicted GNAT family acetyltransferase
MRMLMTVYTCPSVIQPKAIDGEIRKVTAEDTEAIADMVRNFEAECFRTEPMSEEKARSAAEKIIDNKMSFVVCRDGMPVAYAISRTAMCVAGYASVNNVYTQPEFRGRGYAAALAAHISRLILEDGKTPLLYADAKNPASNKAYRNVGFIPGGQVLNIEFGGFSS